MTMAFESEAVSPLQARAAELNARLSGAHPSEILRAAIAEFGAQGRLALVSSFGAESAVLLHLAAWTLLFSLPYLLDSAHDNKRAPHENSADSRHSIYFTIIMNATWVLYFYFNALLLVPFYIYRKKYWQFALIQLLVLGWLMLQLYLVSYFVFGESHFHSRSVMFNFFIYLFITYATFENNNRANFSFFELNFFMCAM